MRRSTVLSLPLLLVFPDVGHYFVLFGSRDSCTHDIYLRRHFADIAQGFKEYPDILNFTNGF